jgi:hypothetical protein
MYDDYQPSPEILAKLLDRIAAQGGTREEVDVQTEAFVNFWMGKSEKRANWHRSWITWMNSDNRRWGKTSGNRRTASVSNRGPAYDAPPPTDWTGGSITRGRPNAPQRVTDAIRAKQEARRVSRA